MNHGDKRGYKWESFKENNLAARTHGVYCDRLVAPRAAEIVSVAVAAIPWLTNPEYAAVVGAWSRAEARCLLVAEYLDEHGLLDENGTPRPAADLAIKLEKTAAEARRALGIDPVSRSKLERNLAASARDRVDIARELAEGRRLREDAEARDAHQQAPGDELATFGSDEALS